MFLSLQICMTPLGWRRFYRGYFHVHIHVLHALHEPHQVLGRVPAAQGYQMQKCLGLEGCKVCHAFFPWGLMPVMHVLATQIFRGLPNACSAWEIPSPRNTNWSPVAGHAIQIFLESKDSITSCNLPDPDIFAIHMGHQFLMRLGIHRSAHRVIKCKYVWEIARFIMLVWRDSELCIARGPRRTPLVCHAKTQFLMRSTQLRTTENKLVMLGSVLQCDLNFPSCITNFQTQTFLRFIRVSHHFRGSRVEGDLLVRVRRVFVLHQKRLDPGPRFLAHRGLPPVVEEIRDLELEDLYCKNAINSVFVLQKLSSCNLSWVVIVAKTFFFLLNNFSTS